MAQTRALCYDKPLQIKMKEICHNLLQIAKKKIENNTEEDETRINRRPRNTSQNTLRMNADNEKVIKEQLNLMQRNQQTLQHVKNQKNEEQFLNITEKMRLIWLQAEDSYGPREDLDKHFIIINAIIKDFANDLTDTIAHMTSAKSETIDIRTIEKFLTISAYHNNANIFTIIKIPLTISGIIKFTPLPTHKANKTFIFIEVNHPIIAIDAESRTYFTPTESDLEKCNYPIHYIDDGSLCEVQLDTYINNCNIQHTHKHNNMDSAKQREFMAIFHMRKTNEIKRTGRITLKEKCKLTIQDVIIRINKPAITIVAQTSLPNYNLITTNDEQKFERIKEFERKTRQNKQKQLNNNYSPTNKHIIYSVMISCTEIIITISKIPLETNINLMCKLKTIQEHIYSIASGVNVSGDRNRHRDKQHRNIILNKVILRNHCKKRKDYVDENSQIVKFLFPKGEGCRSPTNFPID
ncbi:hypothetical protein ACFW04_014745 [Cataglyphis niger]